MIYYHGTYAADIIRAEGFRVAGDDGVISKYGMPWVSLTDDRDLAESIGEVLTVDISGLRIMPKAMAEQGPNGLRAFVAWVITQGYDGFEHPQENDELGIVLPAKLRLL